MTNDNQPKYTWWPYQALAAREAELGRRALALDGWRRVLYEFVRFGLKQAWACLFGGLMLALFIGTFLWYPQDAALARYDFLVLAALAIQAGLLLTRMETLDEAKIILLYHVTGTLMEVFKTHAGSWQYPEHGLLKIAGVPLFSGFMYSCVGSYIARAWRLFDFTFTRHPSCRVTTAISIAIYVNFFTHHYFHDVRWLILLLLVPAFGRTWIHFRIHRHYRRMPLLVGFFLVALFIWFAENISTATHAWIYPNQKDSWRMVSFGKLTAWYLLMIISYVMVSWINKPKSYMPLEAKRETPC
ncbi:MAG: DUF817 domain-containing protein [Azoarcus sp.]|jgi:uncharacterized membrane protein YoaT (DUF817 family)|nr:DUF817 domain-containing protein [Azoarcus sp.]